MKSSLDDPGAIAANNIARHYWHQEGHSRFKTLVTSRILA